MLERISWDDLRVFMVAARTLSFRKAATALRTAPTTVLRRIERLEENFEFRVFDRMPEGLSLTAEGRVLRGGKTLVFCEGEVRDAAGHLVAKGVGTFRLKKRKPAADAP